MNELTLVLAGIFIASAAMAIGIGGGILWTPLLILAYELSPQESISTSLLIQIVGLGSGSVAYFRNKLVETRLSLLFFLAALPGVIIGSFITFNLPEKSIQMALGIMAMIIAILFVSSNDEFITDTKYKYRQSKVNRILPVPVFFGFIMGFLSLGINEWLIPLLKSHLKLSMRRAIGTVIPSMFLLAVVASGMHYSISRNIHLDIFIWGAIGTLIGGQIGVYISSNINERLLKQCFIYLMTLIGVHLIFQAI